MRQWLRLETDWCLSHPFPNHKGWGRALNQPRDGLWRSCFIDRHLKLSARDAAALIMRFSRGSGSRRRRRWEFEPERLQPYNGDRCNGMERSWPHSVWLSWRVLLLRVILIEAVQPGPCQPDGKSGRYLPGETASLTPQAVLFLPTSALPAELAPFSPSRFRRVVCRIGIDMAGRSVSWLVIWSCHYCAIYDAKKKSSGVLLCLMSRKAQTQEVGGSS